MGGGLGYVDGLGNVDTVGCINCMGDVDLVNVDKLSVARIPSETSAEKGSILEFGDSILKLPRL